MALNDELLANPSDEELVSGWIFDCGYRGTLDIIYSCGMVLIAAIWTVIHPNVPMQGESGWRIFVRRLRWGFVGIFAPDFLTLMAASQHQNAKRVLREIRELDSAGDWSLEHAFYANSGGK